MNPFTPSPREPLAENELFTNIYPTFPRCPGLVKGQTPFQHDSPSSCMLVAYNFPQKLILLNEATSLIIKRYAYNKATANKETMTQWHIIRIAERRRSHFMIRCRHIVIICETCRDHTLLVILNVTDLKVAPMYNQWSLVIRVNCTVVRKGYAYVSGMQQR